MALDEGDEPNDDDRVQPEGSSSGDELSDRLAKLDVPSAPTLPPPPDIQFQRPTLGAGNHSQAPEYKTTVKIGADRPRNAPPPSGQVGSAASAGALMGAGITFAASVVVGVLIGGWIDKRFGWAPWGMIVLTLAGIAAGFVNLFRLLAIDDRANRQNKK